MARTATIMAEIDPNLKTEVENIFKELGITTAEAIDAFYHKVKQHHGLPFDMEMPNEETLQAMYEAEKGIDLIVCENAEDMFKKLDI